MRVYLDNAATTKVDEAVVKAMATAMTETFGNASSIHGFGRPAHQAIEKARAQVAALIHAQPDEIIFTSGGTESDNTVIFGVTEAYRSKGNHIITTQVEHHAILHACEQLEKRGFTVTYLPVDEYGRVTAEQVEAAITDQTILVSVMYGNNEVGTIMPIAEIGKVTRAKGVLFHTDAVQAAGQIPVDVVKDQVDLLTLTGHKLHGPKGSGALYVRKGVRFKPILFGGAQEKKLRPGTENVPGIVGFGVAAELAAQRLANDGNRKMRELRNYLMKGLLERIPEVKVNGHTMERLPNNVNVSIKFIEGEGMLLSLDMAGIAASSGSACTSGSLDPSHVLLAMGLDHATAHGSLRLTLSHDTTAEEIDYVLETLPPIVERLRSMSPLWQAAHSEPVGSCARQNKEGCACPFKG